MSTNVTRFDGEWNEEDHPRDEAGRFGTGSGLSSAAHSKASGAHVQAMVQHEGKEIAARRSGDTATAQLHREAAAAHGKAAEEHELVARGHGSEEQARNLSGAAHAASAKAKPGIAAVKQEATHHRVAVPGKGWVSSPTSETTTNPNLAATFRNRGEAEAAARSHGGKVESGHLKDYAFVKHDEGDVVRAVARFDGGSEGLSRFDVGELGKAKRLKNGWLKAEAYLTRSGVFHYRLPDGKIQREYRPPSEVFNADSLDTLQLVPVTDEHPPEMLNAVNTVDYSRGAVGERVRKDGSKVAAPLMVQHKDLIAKMDRGSNQVSCGYTCDLDFTAGVTPSGEKYDAVQKNIRYNHVAILERGRAGPDVRVRMDGAGEAVLLDRGIGSGSTTSHSERTMHKIKIGGITFDVDDSRLAEAINNEFARRDSEVEQLRKDAASLAESSKKEKAELTAKLDTATDTIAKRDAAIKELPAKLAKEAKARGDLVAKVRAVVGSKKKLDGLSDKELQLLALERLAPSKKFDEADDVTIAAHFTARFDHFEEENPEASRFDAFAKKGKGAESKEEEEEENEEEKKVGKKDRDDDEPRGPAYRGHFDRAEDEERGVTLDADEIRERTRKYNARLHLQPIPGARTRKGAYSEH